MLTPENAALLSRLAPFARRAKCFTNGREKLDRIQRRLAFILLAEDISENSRTDALRTYRCPIYQALTAAEIESTFGMTNTKLLGFLNGGMSSQLEKCFQDCRINATTPPPVVQKAQ